LNSQAVTIFFIWKNDSNDRAFFVGHFWAFYAYIGRRSACRKRNKRRMRANERRRLDPFSFSVRQTEIKIKRLCSSRAFNETRFEAAAPRLKRAFYARNCVWRHVGEARLRSIVQTRWTLPILLPWIQFSYAIINALSYYGFNEILTFKRTILFAFVF